MPRILIAHGFGTNAEIAETRTPNLKAALEKAGYQLKYIQASQKLTIEDFGENKPSNDITKNSLYSWWSLKDGINDPTPTLDYIKSQTTSGDDIVGIIGLSQGGSLAGIVSANRANLIPSLKFGVAYGGFYFPTPSIAPKKEVYDGKITIPFLTVVGNQDDHVTPEVSIQFADEQVESGKSDVYRHDGGHIFADDEASVKYVVDWIKALK